MATLNLSTNGPSISKSYQSIVNSSAASGSSAQSPTYGQWAVYSVSAPLANAFQQDAGSKESILKVQGTGEGELNDIIDEFSDGRIQFAFIKVKDPKTSLPKNVLIAWCGEGVPERTKGYFTSHLTAVSKVLHGYHVQITARSDRDLTPEGIVQKVSDASGSDYSAASAPSRTSVVPPPVSSKPAFMPTRSSGGISNYNPLIRSNAQTAASKNENVDKDGWGSDAPPVTRTRLEKVQSSYRPTTVNMRELSSQSQEQSQFDGGRPAERPEVVKGAYQPIGKVDIAALRREAQANSSAADDRPISVRGAYEPVRKVDIAAIRAKAHKPSEDLTSSSRDVSTTMSTQSVDRINQSAPYSASERLSSLPKPKITNRFAAGSSNFAGTKAPTPGIFGLESQISPSSPPAGVGRTFADQGGKTPAQIWAEKKARERGAGEVGEQAVPARTSGVTSPLPNQTSGSGEWKSGYSGKSWAPVQTTNTGQSATSLDQQHSDEDDQQQEEAQESPMGGVGAIRDKFKGAAPMGAPVSVFERAPPSPPPLNTSTKPRADRGIPIPGLSSDPARGNEEEHRMPIPPPQPPRSPTPPSPTDEESSSPIQVAIPVSRGHDVKVADARKEQFSPPPSMPIRSLAQQLPHEDELTEETPTYDSARAAGEAVASNSFGEEAIRASPATRANVPVNGKHALAQYDYEKAEDNELELREGEYVTEIDMVDEDWWMGRNSRGESGLFPCNYVELVDDDEPIAQRAKPENATDHGSPEVVPTGISSGAVATALYDYEAVEDNELSFPQGAKITNIDFPDEDWWSGEHGGKSGLFPANYVQIDEE